MAEQIEKCFLIDEHDYETFDSIIKVLTNKNEVVSILALGTKKILSKNGRNLKYGSLLEVEYFKARSQDSLSKLKKIKTEEDNQIDYKTSLPLIVLNWYISSKNQKQFNFNFYKTIIDKLKQYDEQTMLIYVLYSMIKDHGHMIHLESCRLCNSKRIKTISISKQGYLCESCAIKSNEYIHSTEFNKIFICLAKEQLDEIQDFNEKEALTKFLKSYLYHNCGIYIYDILGDK